jgi:hypothetical protein
MARYLAIFIGAASATQKPAISPEQSQGFMAAWAAWARRHAAAIVDPGTPLAATKRVDVDGIADISNACTAFMIVEAGDHEAAALLFADHPHVALLPGNAVEVMECPPLPGTG